jgi:hypothetical protein
MKHYHHCRYCGCLFATNYHPQQRPPNAPTHQHILPTRRGGGDTLENLRPCCLRCNGLLEAADDCPAALVCARTMLGHVGDTMIIQLVRSWPRAEEVAYG